jgi:RNA binding exosome subunit
VIHRLTIRAFVAATEDEERVRKAMALFVPEDSISTTCVTGYYGNKITILEAEMDKKKGLPFFKIIKEQLPQPEMDRLKVEIEKRVDDNCRFYLRFDKQAAYMGEVHLMESGDTIDVCAHIESYPAKPAKAAKIIGELL